MRCGAVSRERRLLFIHIPKNAGSSIREALDLPGRAELSTRHPIRGLRIREAGMICHHRKLTFIHVPKNAGNAIAKWLGEAHSPDHRPWFEYAEESPKLWEEYTSFAIIRNPWDRLVSLYRWWSKYQSKAYHLWRITSFPELIEDCELGFPYGNSFERPRNHWRQQAYLISRRGELRVDRLLRFEQLAEDWEAFMGPDPLPVVNRLSDGRHYSAWYNDAWVEIVRRAYEDDVRLGGYEFERIEPFDPTLGQIES